MCQPVREHLIARHNFYIEQAHNRLLSQFQNMEAEANQYAETWLEKSGKYFDPDRHDPDDFSELAYEKGEEYYFMLDDMLFITRLSVVAGIFHEWDKQLRSWLIQIISHWHNGNEVKKAVWKSNFNGLIDLLEGFGWKIRTKNYYKSLDNCRLVVNVFKHGDGGSLDTIKQKCPEFIDINPTFFDKAWCHIDYTNLKIDDSHIGEFSDAIVEFWKDVPEDIIWKNELINLPQWFKSALEKDRLS